MIDKAKIKYFLSEILDGTELFLVDLVVKPSNKIIIEIDNFKGVSIGECAHVSHEIESKLNREDEDFDLEVTSPGLGLPLKVVQQYEKNMGKQVSVVLKDGTKKTGKLVEVTSSGIKIELQEKIIPEGKKKPEVQINGRNFSFDEIKATKVVINF